MIIWNLFGSYVGLLRTKKEGKLAFFYGGHGKTRIEVIANLLELAAA